MKRLLAGCLMAWVSGSGFAALPDLDQLKLAAESGDPVAQFQYANRLTYKWPEARVELLVRSGKQGYVPAQVALADHYASPGIEIKDKTASHREAVRWASRAAHQGLPLAQVKLGRCYEDGTGVAKDLVKAYAWYQVAAQNEAGDSGGMKGTKAKGDRDRLIPLLSAEEIQEGQLRAVEFQPGGGTPGINEVEADVLFSALNLTAIVQMKGKRGTVVNGTRFFAGETKDLKIDGANVALTCLAIEAKSTRMRLAGTSFEREVVSKK